jgi:hypothetical protein
LELRLARQSGQPESLASNPGFRTFQVRPKDLSILIWQVERAGDPASKREGHAMGERTIDRRQSKISDTQAMAIYSTLLFFVMLLWAYVPA